MSYFGGYYLLKLKTLEHEPYAGKVIYTCSNCFNTSLYDSWSLSWTTKELNELEDVQRALQINDDTINRISIGPISSSEKLSGSPMFFLNLEALKEYRTLFFLTPR